MPNIFTKDLPYVNFVIEAVIFRRFVIGFSHLWSVSILNVINPGHFIVSEWQTKGCYPCSKAESPFRYFIFALRSHACYDVSLTKIDLQVLDTIIFTCTPGSLALSTVELCQPRFMVHVVRRWSWKRLIRDHASFKTNWVGAFWKL